MNFVKMKPGRYNLERVTDKAGDSGHHLVSLDPGTLVRIGDPGELHLGARIQCGSSYARTMQWQDWWMTSVLTEFIETSADLSYVKFRTNNSVYEVWSK